MVGCSLRHRGDELWDIVATGSDDETGWLPAELDFGAHDQLLTVFPSRIACSSRSASRAAGSGSRPRCAPGHRPCPTFSEVFLHALTELGAKVPMAA